jgi:hypothetical protein
VTPKSEPILPEEKRYTQWQEAVRKDIERAFGVLKCTWQFMDRPIHLMKLEDIQAKVICCLILHNILVSDRVMGDPRIRYKPDQILEEELVVVQQPSDLRQVQQKATTGGRAPPYRVGRGTVGRGIPTDTVPWQQVQGLTRHERFKELSDVNEYNRLRTALTARFITGYPRTHTQREASNGDDAAAALDTSPLEGSSNGEGSSARVGSVPATAAGDS